MLEKRNLVGIDGCADTLGMNYFMFVFYTFFLLPVLVVVFLCYDGMGMALCHNGRNKRRVTLKSCNILYTNRVCYINNP